MTEQNQQPIKDDIVVKRIIDAPVELVWKAWTDPEYVMRWWGPSHYTSPSAKIDLREGGQFLFHMKAPENQGSIEHYSVGTYKRIVPNKKLEFTQSLADKDGTRSIRLPWACRRISRMRSIPRSLSKPSGRTSLN
jgi:uncharacterized protein YndB with AHSA1/START domain